MSNNKVKIKAAKMQLDIKGFEDKEDERQYDIFTQSLDCMDNGIVITPIYNDSGELMSIIIDTKQVSQVIEEIERLDNGEEL